MRSQGGQKKTLHRHPQRLSEGFRHTNTVLGTGCTGVIKVVRSQRQRSSSLICEAERERKRATSRFIDIDLLYLQPT